MRTIIHALFLFFLTLGGATFAQTLEVVPLRHRSAEQVIPQVQPFLEPGGALSGMNDRLFIRTSARNLAQLRELIASIDTPVRRLMISLRSDGETDSAADGAGAGGRVLLGDGKVSLRGTASVYSSDRHRSDDLQQQIQTIEGGRALIRIGQSFLLPLRQVLLGPGGAIVSETLVQRDVGNGFVAIPRLAGETVTLEIAPQIETLNQAGGVVESQRLYTTVSGRLGEWIRLGGADSNETVDRSGAVHYGTRTQNRARRLLVKVDLLP